ncbi:carboxymuconolactone decarboxylase family protein [Actinocorallia longicatena]|uniref:Carboxymuconolactone decarboxylase family protein n=1 Tax=Actinocorallia longicatena TaxID=111803 RepID=A0ABP6Q4N2_9ACTN
MRLPPLPDGQWDDTVRKALSVMLPTARQNPDRAGNAIGTLVRHPDLTAAFLTFNSHLLLRSSLPPRQRELAILRIARRRGCAYEWGHHVRIAGKVGLTEAEIEDAAQGKAAGELDSAVLRAVDELDEDSDLSDATWAVLSSHLEERQVMDLVFTIGAYIMCAMAFNAFGIELEH